MQHAPGRLLALSLLVLTMVVATPAARAQPSATTLPIVATIPVGNYPTWVSVNQATNQIYVANFDSGTMSVIDGNTNRVVQTIAVGAQPRSIAFNPATNRVYVADNGLGVVKVFDAANDFAPITTIHTHGAWHVEVNPATNTVYVTNPHQGQFEVVNGVTSAVITTVVAYRNPTDVAVDSLTNDYYVTLGKSSTVGHYNGTTNQLMGSPIRVGVSPDRIAYDQSTNDVYVANNTSANVSVINGATDRVVATVPITGYAVAGNVDKPDGIASDGNLLFVSTITNPGYLLELDAATYATLASLQVGDQAIGVAVNPLNQLVYVTSADANTVTVVSASVGASAAHYSATHLAGKNYNRRGTAAFHQAALPIHEHRVPTEIHLRTFQYGRTIRLLLTRLQGATSVAPSSEARVPGIACAATVVSIDRDQRLEWRGRRACYEPR